MNIGSSNMHKHAIFRTLYVPPKDVEIKVPYSFLGSVYDSDDLEAIQRVIKSEWLTTGQETPNFENAFAKAHDVKYAFTTTNCTTALHMAAQLGKLKPGDEVITTPITFIATNEAILGCGATPVFVDIDPRTFNIDPKKIEEKITAKTKAIFLTHLTGQMCEMDEIMEIAKRHDLYVVEDCAHTAGATYKGRPAGSIGDVGCFSFHAIKNMTTLGEGGMFTTNRDDIGLKVPWLRYVGSRYPADPHEDGSPGPRAYDIDDIDGIIPSNASFTDVQSAVGIEQLKKLPRINDRRRKIAREFSNSFKDIPGITVPYEDPNCKHVYHIYALVIDPDQAGFTNLELANELLYRYGIQNVPGLYKPSYLFTLYQKRGYKEGLCPIAEKISGNSLQLPLHPRLTGDEMQYIIDSVHASVQNLRNK